MSTELQRPTQTKAAFRRKRNTLKKALRKYASRFNMHTYLQYDGHHRPETIRKFEECGTACCIAGMSDALWGAKYGSHQLHVICGFGTQSPIYVERWPEDLEDAYNEAAARNDYTGMVEAACRVIDLQPYTGVLAK